MQNTEQVERNKKIYEMRKSGKTYREIGETFDISANRAMQLAHKGSWQNNPGTDFSDIKTG